MCVAFHLDGTDGHVRRRTDRNLWLPACECRGALTAPRPCASFPLDCVESLRFGCGNSMSADDVLWFREPAPVWEEALPLGTGRLGAMAFGGLDTALLQLNDDRLLSEERPRTTAGGPCQVAR